MPGASSVRTGGLSRRSGAAPLCANVRFWTPPTIEQIAHTSTHKSARPVVMLSLTTTARSEFSVLSSQFSVLSFQFSVLSCHHSPSPFHIHSQTDNPSLENH